jgi:N-methylhydantoinase A/oxoprolinase/acetone carboxylase beta subunit
VLGRIDAGAPQAGVDLDAEAAHRTVAELGDALGLDAEACAEGIVRVANTEMVRALRVMTVERGVDPRAFALLAFGGAGPLHAVAIADELDMSRILIPSASGVLSALGLAAADRRADAQRTVLGEDHEQALEELRAAIRGRLGDAADLTATYDVRYAGQAHELSVADPADFPARHEERYGYRDDAGAIEVVTVRVTGRVAGAEVDLRGDPAPLAVPDGWTGRADDSGTLILERA